MVVQHNLTAMNSNRMLGLTTASQTKSTERLSSGYKINRAADDASGLSISEKMRKQVRGLTQASANAQDGISTVQTAEGALTEVHDMLQRMNELAVKASNGTQSEKDRDYIQNEMDQLVTEIDRVSTTTKFNEIYLLKGRNATDGEVAKLSYDTAATNLADTLIASGRMDADKGVISMNMADPTAALASAAATNTDVSAKSVTVSIGGVDTEYVLVQSAAAVDPTDAAGYLSLEDAVNEFNDLDDVKAFSSMDDLLAAVKKDSDASGDVKSMSSEIKADGTMVIKADVFADLNSALDVSLHVGADSTSDNKISINLNMMSARGLGINGIKVSGDTSANADAAIDTISTAVQRVSAQRSSLGAVQNRLEHTMNNLDNIVENTTSAESAIRDTDMATEMVKYSNNNILSQAGQAMLAQANQVNQGVLSLLS